MEDRGVDEVYIDFTAVPGGQEGGRWRRASSRPSMPTGLNKLLAKMASEFRSRAVSPSCSRRIWSS
jgi:DNA polymerase-4